MLEPEATITLPAQSIVQQQLRSLQGFKILIVDDDEDVLLLIATILEQYGATVTAVGSALAALQALQVQPQAYNLLLSDLGMPETDGWSLIRQVRALAAEAGGNIPAVALTAYSTKRDRNISRSFGFQVLIAKPIEPEHLIATVVKTIGTPMATPKSQATDISLESAPP
jgi:two-component system, chemotaxis family, CheB/CheR fusion protein